MSKPFKLRSGNSTSFKMMGSTSPAKWHKPGHGKTFRESLRAFGKNIKEGKAMFGSGEGQIPATTKEAKIQSDRYQANLDSANVETSQPTLIDDEDFSVEEEMIEEDNERMDIIGQNGNDGLHYDSEDDEKPKKVLGRGYYRP